MDSRRPPLAELQASFEGRLQAHAGMLRKVVASYAWEAEEQKDLHQEIVAQLWAAFPRYDEHRPFGTWITRVALNTAISWSRKARLRRRHASDADPDAVPAPAVDGDAFALYQLIERLGELDRALMLLSLEERPHAEIGEILGISPANVATRLSRVRARLRELAQ